MPPSNKIALPHPKCECVSANPHKKFYALAYLQNITTVYLHFCFVFISICLVIVSKNEIAPHKYPVNFTMFWISENNYNLEVRTI